MNVMIESFKVRNFKSRKSCLSFYLFMGVTSIANVIIFAQLITSI